MTTELKLLTVSKAQRERERVRERERARAREREREMQNRRWPCNLSGGSVFYDYNQPF